MKFAFNHYNYNVLHLEKSIAFYEAALGLKEVRRKEAPDGSWKLVYLGDGELPLSPMLLHKKQCFFPGAIHCNYSG